MSDDSPSSIEEGLTLGYGYAERHRDDRQILGRIARARSAPEVAANIDLAEIPADPIADQVAFWSGFAHGVKRYLSTRCTLFSTNLDDKNHRVVSRRRAAAWGLTGGGSVRSSRPPGTSAGRG